MECYELRAKSTVVASLRGAFQARCGDLNQAIACVAESTAAWRSALCG